MEVFDLCEVGLSIPEIKLVPGNVISFVTDDGPSGLCGQSMDITCPHMAIHVFENYDEYSKWRYSGEPVHRRSQNIQERIAIVGEWSSPGKIKLFLHQDGVKSDEVPKETGSD